MSRWQHAGVSEDIMCLQQPWLWFAGVHGMEPQHCMLF
jgi:hypothetical protein